MSDISFSVKGQGRPVILLHGFPMNRHIWDDFSAQLSANHQVYTPDLPGFGESALPFEKPSLSDIADLLITWVISEKIPQPVVIGHSLGGYVALAMVKKRADLFAGFGLFHSTALADNQERKESRTKVVDFVERNGAAAFTENFIAPLFADSNNTAIPAVRKIARSTSARTVIAYTLAMRDRENEEATIAKFPKPIFFLGGDKDQGISPDSLRLQAAKSQLSELHILTGVAHMGMVEQPVAAMSLLHDFIARCHS
jgi:pimeloyl-ACP methyl ester carboxylesterase